MTDHISMLCIGGPHSGQRFAVRGGNGFRVAVSPCTSVGDPTKSESVTVAFTDYRAEFFHTPQGDVSFWVPVGQTPLQTLTILLEVYERAERIS